LPVAFSLFLLMAVFNGLTGQDVQASETPTLSMVSIDPGTAGTATELPPDTIIKKTVIKRISKENPTDTIIEEKEEIITGDDLIREREIIRHRDGQRSHVTLRKEGTEDFEWQEKEGERSAVWVESGDNTVSHSGNKVIILDGDDAQVSHQNKVVIRHSGVADESRILYIVDGVQYDDDKVMENLDPDQISEISVIKGEDVKKYTTKQYNGVIVITSKSGKKKN